MNRFELLLPVGPQGHHRFLLLEAGVGQNIALHALPAGMTFTHRGYLISAFPIHSNSVTPKFCNHKVVIHFESEFGFTLI